MAKNIMKMRWILLLCVFLLFYPVSSEGAVKGIGKISNLSGKVLYREKSDIPYLAVQKGAIISKGYWIKTGSDGWAVLALNDGSSLTLANNTELEITELVIGKNKKSGVFSMTQGKLRASVVKLAGERVDYKVKSPTAVAGIKGTEFMMMTQGHANVFFGNKGKAKISGYDTSEKTLSVDTMVQNTRGYSPTNPVKIEPDTPLHTAKKNFEEITGIMPPEDWELSGNLPNIIARWNINYGHYLADSGRYNDALYVFQIALDLTALPEIRSDARLERGAVYSRFLNNPEAALAEYLLILEEYPVVPQRENALYLTGMTLYELGFKPEAKERLFQYKREYPSGKYIGNVETLLNVLER
ncbi:MAG: FecR domain-containing protein [Nitrospirota bacterium]